MVNRNNGCKRQLVLSFILCYLYRMKKLGVRVLKILPVIDIREGKSVRILHGDSELNNKIYSEDPLKQALYFQEAGADLIHVVDLDGAFTGRPVNLGTVKDIIKNTSIKVQLSGGLRNINAVSEAIDAGVESIVLGTAAIRTPFLVKQAVEKYGDKVIVGIDSKDGMVAIEGWESVVPKTSLELAKEMKELGVNRFLYSDVRRDGSLRGPNIDAVTELINNGMKVISSGGVSSLDCLIKLKELNVEAVVVGRAIYEGFIDLAEAFSIIRH